MNKRLATQNSSFVWDTRNQSRIGVHFPTNIHNFLHSASEAALRCHKLSRLNASTCTVAHTVAHTPRHGSANLLDNKIQDTHTPLRCDVHTRESTLAVLNKTRAASAFGTCGLTCLGINVAVPASERPRR